MGSVLAATDLGEARLYKSWWAQAEFMNALCRAYSKTGRRDYFDALVKTFDWIYRYQVDHECGDCTRTPAGIRVNRLLPTRAVNSRPPFMRGAR